MCCVTWAATPIAWPPPISACSYKDYAHGARQRSMTLDATELLRGFFLHVLPKGFVRICHFGLLANRFRHQILLLARRLLAVNIDPLPESA
jgi:Putative transposase